MLREHAFDSGCLFDEELQADETALRDEAVRDYWREQVYPLDEAALAVALATWPNVDALARDVQRMLNQPLGGQATGASLSECIDDASAARNAALAQLKDGWADRAEAMRGWLHEKPTPKVCVFNRKKLQSGRADELMDAIRAWACDPEAQAINGLTDKALFRLGLLGMVDALNEGSSVDLPDHFAAFEALLAALPGVPSAAAALRVHAATLVEAR